MLYDFVVGGEGGGIQGPTSNDITPTMSFINMFPHVMCMHLYGDICKLNFGLLQLEQEIHLIIEKTLEQLMTGLPSGSLPCFSSLLLSLERKQQLCFCGMLQFNYCGSSHLGLFFPLPSQFWVKGRNVVATIRG